MNEPWRPPKPLPKTEPEAGTPHDNTVTVSELSIQPLVSVMDTQTCARLMAASEPWITLGRGYGAALALLSDTTRERYIARRGAVLAGVLVLDLTGALVGYIRTVCVAPEFRNQGIGTCLVRFAEQRIFREAPNVFLCVSSFNSGARRLYERLGYRVIGEFGDYVIRGQSELLMRKTLGPMNDFQPHGGGGD